MNQQSKAMVLGLAAVLCWSTVATAFKLSLKYISPEQLVLIASFTAWVFLLSLLLIQGRFIDLFRQKRHAYWRSLVFGLINPTLYYFILFYAYDLLPAQEAQAINYSWAVVMTLLAVPLLGQSISRVDMFAAAMCYLGVLVIATRGDVMSLQFESLTGVVLALISTVIWSLYWIYNRRDSREPILGLCLNFSFAIPIIAAYCWWHGDLHLVAWQGLAGGAYVGLVEMGLGFVLWLYAMKYTQSTARIANLIFIAPFISLILISQLLGEPILSSTLIALLLIIGGLAVQQLMAKEHETHAD